MVKQVNHQRHPAQGVRGAGQAGSYARMAWQVTDATVLFPSMGGMVARGESAGKEILAGVENGQGHGWRRAGREKRIPAEEIVPDASRVRQPLYDSGALGRLISGIAVERNWPWRAPQGGFCRSWRRFRLMSRDNEDMRGLFVCRRRSRMNYRKLPTFRVPSSFSF
jgi:hypothetical protein